MLGRPADEYLDTQRAAHLQRMRELTEIKRGGELVDALLADHGLFHLEADLRWIDLTVARLDALAEAGAPMSAADRGPRRGRCRSARRPALRGAEPDVAAGRDPRGHGPERLRQVDPAALPGRHPACPTPARSGSTAGGSTRSARRERSALRRDRFGFVFQFGQLVPELTAEENVALPLLLGGIRRARGPGRGPGAGSTGSAWTGSSSAGPASCPAARRSGSRWPAAWSPGPRCCSPTSRPASLDSLTGEQVMDLLVGAARRAGHHGRPGHPRGRGSPRTPTARSSSATARSHAGHRRGGRVMIRLGLRLDRGRRPGGGHPAGQSSPRRWRSAPACCWPPWPACNAVNAQNDRYAWLNAGRGRPPTQDRPARCGGCCAADYFDGRDDRPGRPRRDRPRIAGPARPVPAARPGGVLRLARPWPICCASPRRTSWPTGSPAGGPASSATPRCPRPTRCSSWSAAPRTTWPRCPARSGSTGIPAEIPPGCGGCVFGIPAAGLNLVLGVVAAGLLFPVLMFIGTATRLAATRREQRFAAMRLVGATPRQIDVIAAVEARRLGAGRHRGRLRRCSSPSATRWPRSRSPARRSSRPTSSPACWPASWWRLGVPVAAAVVARLALRRVRISPLGVSRRQTPAAAPGVPADPAPDRPGRTAVSSSGGGRRPPRARRTAFLPGFLIIMIGLVVAGPWLTMAGARPGRAARPAAGRR